MARFIYKRPSKKYIRPVRYGEVDHSVKEVIKKDKDVAESQVKGETEKVVKETKINNMEKTDKMTDNNLEKVKALVGNDVEVPKRRVKREKKDKGLIERTEGSEILLTEDNKMLLND